jgi:hypothetical protein
MDGPHNDALEIVIFIKQRGLPIEGTGRVTLMQHAEEKSYQGMIRYLQRLAKVPKSIMPYIDRQSMGTPNLAILIFNRYAVGVMGFLFCFTVLISHYIVYVRPLILNDFPQVAGAFELVAALFLFMWQKAILSDPGVEGKRKIGNSAVEEGQRALANGENFSAARLCYTCWRIRGPRSKHCPMVDGCVEGFDHYCVFIDNTVGGGNHRLFVTVLCIEILMQSIYSSMYFYAFKTVLHSDPYTGKRWHACGIMVIMLFNCAVLCGLTGLCKSQFTGILQNLTYYEVIKRPSLTHFWPSPGRFQNPFHDGFLGNCVAFWTKSRRMTFADKDDPWAESNRLLASASTGGKANCARALQRTVRSLFPWCRCAHRAKTADEDNTDMKDV